MPIYMNYNKIPGDVTADGHAKWIELNKLRFGIGRGIASPTGAFGDRESSAPSVTRLRVTKVQRCRLTQALTAKPFKARAGQYRSISAKPIRGT